MAEGWARKLLPAGVRIWSAGARASEAVHPNAVAVMREVGVDISAQRPKLVSDVPLGDVDTVVTLCAEDIPLHSSRDLRRETWSLPDPTKVQGGEQERLAAFRAVREELRRRIDALILRDA
jgi:arsenate reductase